MSQIILDSANDLIQGDFDNATLSQRTRLQTSTINATTGVYIVPNGTANAASVQISNAADPTNASKVVLATNGSTDTQIISGANGSGTYLPLSFYTNNDIRFQMGNNGELNVRTAPGTVSSGSSGQVLTSGGPGAGVSWATAASGQLRSVSFNSPGTWTVPSTTTAIKVTVIGGGGGGQPFVSATDGAGGGAGGLSIGYITGLTSGASIPITVGSGGGVSTPGGTSSIGPVGSPALTISATGGTGATGTTGVAPGTGTGFGVSVGMSSANAGGGSAAGTIRGITYNSKTGATGMYLSVGGTGSTGGVPGTAGTVGGGGGGGAAAGSLSAGAGGNGLVLIEFVG